MMPVTASISLLTPYDIDRPKLRIGPKTDGGYIMAAPLRPEQTVLSYGISMEYRFDEEMARRGHRVHMFDHTIEPLNPSHANMSFHGEGVAGVSAPEKRLFSIEDHLQKYDIRGDDLILKIDVEGAELEVFAAMTPATLGRFDQIVMEVHGLNVLADDAYRASFDAAFETLNAQFTLFHVHANNFDGDHLGCVAGHPVASLMELSYVRTSGIRRTANATLYPTDLDYPCVEQKDKMLWFFPFLPTHVAEGEFREADRRLERLRTRTERMKRNPDRDFDVAWYRAHYRDLSGCSDEYLAMHFHEHGIGEGRLGSAKELLAFDDDA